MPRHYLISQTITEPTPTMMIGEVEPDSWQGTTTTTTTTSVLIPPSQAKLRMQAMAASVDIRLATFCTILLIFYATVTLTAVSRIDSQEFNHNNLVATPASSTTKRVEVSIPAIIVPPEGDLLDIDEISTLQHTFPVHVGEDVEFIDHPGMFMANQEQMKKVISLHNELPKDGKMKVPRFWHPTVYGEKGVREFLGENGHRLMTTEEAKSIGSIDPITNLETIYISVASYRDPECQPTVEDIFLRAQYPGRLRVAIIDQRVENDSVPPCAVPERPCSEDPTQTLCKYHHLIDRFEIPAHLSIGPVFARHLANRMYRGKRMMMIMMNLFIVRGLVNVLAQG